jgi:hypothetical protein
MQVGIQPDNTSQGKTFAREGGKMSPGLARKADTTKTAILNESSSLERGEKRRQLVALLVKDRAIFTAERACP